MLDLQNAGFKSLEEVKEIAPSVFTKQGAKGTSARYTHIPTDKVISDMELLGWGVVDAKEVKARKNIGFQKHLVVFRNNDLKISRKGDTVFPQILLQNSHDGKNSFNFTAGLYRMVCENGLVVSTQEFDSVSIRHMGYDFENLKEKITAMVKQLPLTIESMNKMVETELAEDNILALAEDLIKIRLEGTKNTYDFTTLDEVNMIQRKEDGGGDLWSSFNRIQENIIEGNFKYKTPTGKIRFARPVKNFKQDLELNKKMFNKALEYAI